MPSAKDIPPAHELLSILLVGDGGTHKTYFIGTCPRPVYIFDLDAGMGIHAGEDDIDYDTFKELPKGQKVGPEFSKMGFYEWGTAWPALLKKLNEIGAAIDRGENKYKTLAFDSLTLLTDLCLSFIIKRNNGEFKDGRQMWGVFLLEMSNLFAQFTGWPLMKVLTAHIMRNENAVMGTVEKLPNVPGKFSGKVQVYFDEVYYTESTIKDGKPVFTIKTQQDGMIKQAKSRKLNVPNNSPTDFREILKIVAAAKAGVKK